MRSALLLTFGPPTYGTCLRWVCTLDGHSIAINICPWKCSKQANKFHQYVLRELFSRLQDFGCLNLFSVMTVKIDKERMFYGSHSLQGFTWAYHTGLVVFFFFYHALVSDRYSLSTDTQRPGIRIGIGREKMVLEDKIASSSHVAVFATVVPIVIPKGNTIWLHLDSHWFVCTKSVWIWTTPELKSSRLNYRCACKWLVTVEKLVTTLPRSVTTTNTFNITHSHLMPGYASAPATAVATSQNTFGHKSRIYR